MEGVLKKPKNGQFWKIKVLSYKISYPDSPNVKNLFFYSHLIDINASSVIIDESRKAGTFEATLCVRTSGVLATVIWAVSAFIDVSTCDSVSLESAVAHAAFLELKIYSFRFKKFLRSSRGLLCGIFEPFLNPPGRLMHVASAPQLSVPSAHSSISAQAVPSPVKPFLQAHSKPP